MNVQIEKNNKEKPILELWHVLKTSSIGAKSCFLYKPPLPKPICLMAGASPLPCANPGGCDTVKQGPPCRVSCKKNPRISQTLMPYSGAPGSSWEV